MSVRAREPEGSHEQASPDFGIDIWETILWHVKRPRPLPGAPVGRRGWHQRELAACMRVSKMFNSLASRLLYADPVVSDMYSFAYGLDMSAIDGCRTKAACLALVERVFIELPDWHVPPPDFEGAMSTDDASQRVAIEDDPKADQDHDAYDITPYLSEMAWVRRTVEGCGMLEKHDGFRPTRVVFESFYDIVEGHRISSREEDDDGHAVCSALGELYDRIAPLHACCWTGQSLAHIVEYRHTYFDDSSLTKHVGFEDEYDPPLTSFDIRFRPPWVDGNGSKTLQSNPVVMNEFIDFIWAFTDMLQSLEGEDLYAEDKDDDDPPPQIFVDVQPFLPARHEPSQLDRIADNDEYYATQYPAKGHAPPYVAGVGTVCDWLDVEQEDLYDAYESKWEQWCKCLNDLDDGRLIWIRVWDKGSCNACGDGYSDPFCRASTRALDGDLIRRTAAALTFDLSAA